MYRTVCSCTPLWTVMLLTPRESITSNFLVLKLQIKKDNNAQARCDQLNKNSFRKWVFCWFFPFLFVNKERPMFQMVKKQKAWCFIIIIRFSSQMTWKGNWLKFQVSEILLALSYSVFKYVQQSIDWCSLTLNCIITCTKKKTNSQYWKLN